jgi:hypothetical protein
VSRTVTLSPAKITNSERSVTFRVPGAQSGDNSVDNTVQPVDYLWVARATTGVIPVPPMLSPFMPTRTVDERTPVDLAVRSSSTVSTRPSTAVLFNFSLYPFPTEIPSTAAPEGDAA